MKKFFLYLIVFIPCIGFSQNTGYAGRKFILKTDVLYGRSVGFRNLEAEYTIGRKWSVAVGVRTHKADYKQKITNRDLDAIVNSGTYNTNNNPGITPPDVTVSYNTAKVMLRNYFRGISPKAPRGWYFGMMYEFGTAKLTGGTLLEPIKNNAFSNYSFIVKPNTTVKNIAIRMTEFTLGYQEVYAQRFTADFSFGLCFSSFNKNGTKKTMDVTTLSAPYIGPNLIRVGKAEGSSGVGHYQSGFGFSAYIKFGYLIF